MGRRVLRLNSARLRMGASRAQFRLQPLRSEPSCIDSTRGVLMGPTKNGDRHVAPGPELLLLVSRWRARARELLAQAETMRDAQAQQTMREIAAGYERLAQQVEQEAGRADKL